MDEVYANLIVCKIFWGESIEELHLLDNENVMRRAVSIRGHILEFASQRLQLNKELVLLALQHGFQYSRLQNSLKNDLDVVMTAIKHCSSDFPLLPKQLDIKELIKAGFKVGKHNILALLPDMLDDRELILHAIKLYPLILPRIPKKYRSDHEIVRIACAALPNMLLCASKKLRHNKSFVLELLLHGPCNLSKIGLLAHDCDVVLAAIKSKSYILQYTSDELRENREIVLAAVLNNADELRYANSKFREDREIVLAAVVQNGSTLLYAAPKFREDREIVLAAVKTYGKVLLYVDLKFREDREIVLAAVNQYPIMFNCILSPDLKTDQEILFMTFKHDWNPLDRIAVKLDKELLYKLAPIIDSVFLHASPEIRHNKKIVHNILRLNGKSLQYLCSELEYDRETVLLAAINGCPISYIKDTFYNDREIMLACITYKSHIKVYAGTQETFLARVGLTKVNPILLRDPEFIKGLIHMTDLPLIQGKIYKCRELIKLCVPPAIIDLLFVLI